MALQSLDIERRSATTTPSPSVREATKVAKLIDISKCIGCKACQSACMEWNDLRDMVGDNNGTYDNPRDLTENSWTVMRFYEVEPSGKLEWLIRKDGCMHCADPGCLKACPSPGAIVQYSNPVQRAAHFEEGQQGLQVHVVLGSRRRRARAGVHQDLPDRGAGIRVQG
jgi:formate dehydrogenase iron-sulfur subunit